MTTSPFTLSEIESGIYKLVFDVPNEKLNIISVKTMEALSKVIDELKEKKGVKGVIFLSGKKDSFIAGADIKEFEPAFSDPTLAKKLIDQGHNVFSKIAALPFPVVAAIHGICVGGGCELVLACSHRIATDHPKTSLGLPETQLGIFPGWGGTQRLPRLIGLQKGLELIASGKLIDGKKAYKLGLVDTLAVPEFLEETALNFIKNPKKKRVSSGLMGWLLEKNSLGRSLLFSQAKKAVLKKTKGFYPAPLKAIEVIEKTLSLPLKEGLKIEAHSFVSMTPDMIDIARNLIRIFFGKELLMKKGGYPGDLPKGRVVENVAVVGAGTMGGGISWLMANKMIPVRIKDIAWDAIGRATNLCWKIFSKFAARRKISSNEATLKFHQISWTLDYSGFEKADYIIESAPEILDVKRKIYQEIEGIVSKDTLIATNTSSLTMKDLSEGMKHPERFVTMHYFNPANIMPLVEVAAGPKTSPEAIATTIDLAKRIGKVPLYVGDCHGFLVNRIFFVYVNEALFLAENGVPIEQIEKAQLEFGMPMGSFELLDEVGIDVSYKAGKNCIDAYKGRADLPLTLEKLYNDKLLGKKVDKGFYCYKGKNKTPNPKAQAILDSFNQKNPNLTDNEIMERTLLSMINEASFCLEDKIVTEAKFIDLAMIFGTGFPPFRGGVLAYADSIGLPQVCEKLKSLEKSYGKRFKPSNLIEEMAKHNKTFID